MEQYFPAGAAVAASVVMVEADLQIIAKRVQLVIRQLRQQPPPHLAGADILHTGMPTDIVISQALRQHGYIEGRVMGHGQSAPFIVTGESIKDGAGDRCNCDGEVSFIINFCKNL